VKHGWKVRKLQETMEIKNVHAKKQKHNAHDIGNRLPGKVMSLRCVYDFMER
jgi:hypothetical protein